jgi:hypothetical protein
MLEALGAGIANKSYMSPLLVAAAAAVSGPPPASRGAVLNSYSPRRIMIGTYTYLVGNDVDVLHSTCRTIP